ncbi:transcription factor E2F7 [Thalassophryne amazonica]|uniref:transcription factor E2F7 n=1 Tax=Thalassophryne amazonica TaxID=390379 RepID=UPI0014709B6E|nr:transcription factor E2F7 [Thalassophryne amazonica]
MEVECLCLKDLTSPWKTFNTKPHDDDGQSEKKENICAERKRSTPLKLAEAAVPISLIKKRPTSRDLTPIKHTCLAEPWTPTANLKMLISAASPDIREREMKKMLFRPIENENKPADIDDVLDEAEVAESCQFEVEDDPEKKPSRKEKSLGLLCKKFLALYPDYPPLHKPILISLDEVATSLGVGRRRIYDIINVLESLAIVGRIAKNSYIWYGRQRLEATLEELQQRGRQQGYHLQMEMVTEERGAELDDGQQRNGSNATRKWKDKSLRIMSQKFVMLFLVSKTTVTLDNAANILIEESPDSTSHSNNKNKVRRLYDIANVLTSLSLIKKVHVHEEKGRKPAFKWLGPVDFQNSGHAMKVAAVAPADTYDAAHGTTGQKLSSKPKLTRHASLNITPTPVAIQCKVSSAPSSPHSSQMVLPHQPAIYSTKSTSSSTLCQLHNDTNESPTSGLQSPTDTKSRLLPLSCQQGVPLHTEHLFSSSSTPHCVAYLPIMSQSPVLMLYRAPDSSGQFPEGQTSPALGSEERRKRRKEEAENEETAKKLGLSVLAEHDKVSAEPYRGAADGSQPSSTEIQLSVPTGHDTQLPFSGTLNEALAASSSDPAQPSHYLYVPNNAALNNLRFLHSASQSSAAHPPRGVSTLMLPYVLVPSAALSHYPMVASTVQQQGSDAPTPLNFSLPAVMSSAHFMVGAAPCGLTPEICMASLPVPSTTEQTRLYGSATAAPPLSPSEPLQTGNITTSESLTPHTPKESTVSSSKAFFQTPGTLGSVAHTVSTERKRGSAQRRLDIGHPPTS